MLRRIDQTIRDRALLHRGQHVVVGCSGGADSIALLHALWFLRDRWQLRLTVAHLHHGLRGADADADANFVRDLCTASPYRTCWRFRRGNPWKWLPARRGMHFSCVRCAKPVLMPLPWPITATTRRKPS